MWFLGRIFEEIELKFQRGFGMIFESFSDNISCDFEIKNWVKSNDFLLRF